MSKRRKKRKNRKIAIIVILLILVGTAASFIISRNINFDKIGDFEYKLGKDATKLMEENFNLLKEELEKENIDYKKYAEYLSKLFVSDLYTLNNKANKYDITSAEYIYPSDIKNFKSNVQDTLYKYIIEKSKRKEKLASVKSIDLKEIAEEKYTFNGKEYDAYKLIVKWQYEKDYGYDTEAEIIVIKEGKKMYIAAINPEVKDEQN